MNEQELKKSVDETVSKILEAEKPAEPVAKAISSESVSAAPVGMAAPVAVAPLESNPSNGGATQSLADPSAPVVQVAKAADCDDDKDEDDKDEDDKDSDDKKKKDKKFKMKKSIEELSDILDSDELELVKAWREESEKETQIAKAVEAAPAAPIATPEKPGLEEILRKAIADSNADLKKSLDEKDTLIKSLSEKVEKMASQPAYDRRSISNLEVLEKSGPTGNQSNEIKKSQVLDAMLSLQAQGKGITSHHVAEFEATGNISDARVKRTVFQELKLN